MLRQRTLGLTFIFSVLVIFGCNKPTDYLHYLPPVESPQRSVENSESANNRDKKASLGRIVQEFIQKDFTTRYDFLWIMDNSLSMADVQGIVKEYLVTFVSTLQSRRTLDWRMAVTHTDVATSKGSLIEANDGETIVRSDSDHPFQTWEEIVGNIVPTPPTNGWEQGLEASLQAITASKGTLIRSGVPLVLIYLSDENDYSCKSGCNNKKLPETNDEWVPYPVQRYVDYMKLLQKKIGDVLIYPIVHLDEVGGPNSCDQATNTNTPSIGERYLKFREAMGTGVPNSICQDQLEGSFHTVAQLTADRGVCFSLKQPAQSKGIEVKVDGKSIPRSETNGFEYIGNDNKICFTGTYIPKNEARIRVIYSRL